MFIAESLTCLGTVVPAIAAAPVIAAAPESWRPPRRGGPYVAMAPASHRYLRWPKGGLEALILALAPGGVLPPDWGLPPPRLRWSRT